VANALSFLCDFCRKRSRLCGECCVLRLQLQAVHIQAAAARALNPLQFASYSHVVVFKCVAA